MAHRGEGHGPATGHGRNHGSRTTAVAMPSGVARSGISGPRGEVSRVIACRRREEALVGGETPAQKSPPGSPGNWSVEPGGRLERVPTHSAKSADVPRLGDRQSAVADWPKFAPGIPSRDAAGSIGERRRGVAGPPETGRLARVPRTAAPPGPPGPCAAFRQRDPPNGSGPVPRWPPARRPVRGE